SMVLFPNQIIVSGNFHAGDSGALVLTRGSCPQPIGVFSGLGAGKHAIAPIAAVLQNLQSSGGLSTLAVVPTGGGCGVAQIEISTGELESDYTLADGTVP